MFPTDLATFTKEILNGKLHFFVQFIFHKKSRKSGAEGISYFLQNMHFTISPQKHIEKRFTVSIFKA